MKKKLLLCILAITLIIGGCGASESFKKGVEDGVSDALEQNENNVSGDNATSSKKESVKTESEQKEDVSEESEDDAGSSKEESMKVESEIKEDVSEESEIISSGTYEIGDLIFYFQDSVRNDNTGKWRLSKIAESVEPTDYALDYYKTLFCTDDEIHAIINFSKNTTTKISVLSTELLDVTVQEYVDGEEHDAKILFSGNLLKEYHINISTGEIEEL